MAKAPTEKVFGEVKELGVIPKYDTDTTKATYRIRLVEATTDPRIRLDIREHITTNRYVGFTARGISLGLTQIEDMIEYLEKGKEEMEILLKALGKKGGTNDKTIPPKGKEHKSGSGKETSKGKGK